MIQMTLTPKRFFEMLNKDTLHLVDQFYDADVQFSDPIVNFKSRQQVKNYYANLYKNVQTITWEIPEEVRSGDDCALVWTMTLTAQNFNGNKPVRVDGVSVIKFGGNEGKAIYHRDYFDMGAFVYEGLPILGGLVRFIKRKMASIHSGH